MLASNISSTIASHFQVHPKGSIEKQDSSGQNHHTDTASAHDLALIHETLPGMLLRQASLTPQDLAIDSYQCQMTYAELEQNVDKATRCLKSAGFKSGNTVGICFHLSPWAVVTILAIMSLGAAVVAVDPSHPLARRLSILIEAEATGVVVEGDDFVQEMAQADISTINILEAGFGNAQQSNRANFSEQRPEAVAYIPFTSGSTGKPKGILQTHDALVTMSDALASELGIESDSRVAQFHPYVFDVAIMEIGMCLARGATLYITTKKDLCVPQDGEVSLELTRCGITHVVLSPTMLGTMDPLKTSTVKMLGVMGEALGRAAVEKWASVPGRTFVQLWGCTEATILQSITAPITRESNCNNIGKAIDGVCRLWVVDPSDVDTKTAEGDVGELIVESRALAGGYLNRPAETRNAFLNQVAWGDKASRSRYYRTGDLAIKDADGSVRFAGRLDDQMNYHGERIELGEIGFYIDQSGLPSAKNCFSDFDGDSQTVMGFVCGVSASSRDSLLLNWEMSPVSKTDLGLLRKAMMSSGELSEYMVPEIWLPIAYRPSTASGKTDRTRTRQLMRSLSLEQRQDFDVSRQ